MSIKLQSGMSIIEIIIAVALFMIIAVSSTVVVLSSFSSTRLAKEELRATLLAEEGLEAVQSIRNQDWNNLNAGTYGLSNSGGNWVFSGASDVDPSGKYNRSITISPVQRDGNGNIVSTGGAIDSQTYLIEASVNWDFTPARNNTVRLGQYLTQWQLSIGSGVSGGPTPTPPVATTCADYCATQAYSTGTCRANINQCSSNGETNLPTGDIYCIGGGGSDTCCCLP